MPGTRPGAIPVEEGGGIKRLLVGVLVALGVAVGAAANEGNFGLGGFVLSWLTLDLAETNAVLGAAGYPTLGETVLLTGGSGSRGVAGGVSIGALGISGTTDAIAGGRSLGIEVEFSGITVDLAARPAQRILVAVGVALGKGSIALTARTRFAYDVADALTSPTTTRLNASFFGGMAALRLRINIAGGIWLEGWTGYVLGFPGRWEDDGRPLAGPAVPAQGPLVGVGISFGGFPPPPRAPVVNEDPRGEDTVDHKVPQPEQVPPERDGNEPATEQEPRPPADN